MLDPFKYTENFVEGKIGEVKAWGAKEEGRLKLDIQIAALSKIAEVLQAEAEKLKADLLKLPA